MSSSRTKALRLWPASLLLLLPMALALWDFDTWRDRATTSAAPAPDASATRHADGPEQAPSAPPAGRRARPASSTASTVPPASDVRSACEPYARKACHQGDVWWFDACGAPTERVEACDGRPCLGVGCAPASTPEDACEGVSAYGTCSGDVASACVAGALVTIDCADTGRRCVATREGARCARRSSHDCSTSDLAMCNGDTLRRCVDGRWEDLDCAKRLGRCAVSGGSAQCIGAQAPRASEEPLERCDGEDDDGDGLIDEDAACDAIPLVAFVAGASVPEGFEARMERDLAVVNRVYHPLAFRWARTVSAQVPARVRPDVMDELARLLSRSESRAHHEALRVQPGASGDPLAQGLEFYIPVLFVEAITSDPPTAGQASLPNSTCGGVRISDRPAPPDGIIVVSASRQPDTLAHEIGHYLGLCHTHEELSAYGLAAHTAECEPSGDGICDTPWDPGPERCALMRGCGIACTDAAARPDVSNVMSYYMPCRRGLSAEQLAVVERGLHLRRGWFRCLDPDWCRCLPGEPGDCPTEMSCQPSAADGTGVCKLDGPALPGAPCDDLSDCSDGAVCMGTGVGGARVSRCVRACRVSDTDCVCSDVGLPFPVCSEDMAR